MAKPSKSMGSKKESKSKKRREEKGEFILTPPFRLSWPALDAPKKGKKGGKYEVTMLFPKTADLSDMKRIRKEALIDKFGRKAVEEKKIKFTSALRKGEEKEDLEGYAGSIFTVAKTKFQPGCVKKTKKGPEIVDVDDIQEVFYPGCWCVAKVNSYAYDEDGNRGANYGLKSIMKVKDDERFGGGPVDATEDFEDYDSDDSDDEDEDDEDFYGDDEDEEDDRSKKSKSKKKSSRDEDDDGDDSSDDLDEDDDEEDDEDDRRSKKKKKSKPSKKSRRDDDDEDDEEDEIPF